MLKLSFFFTLDGGHKSFTARIGFAESDLDIAVHAAAFGIFVDRPLVLFSKLPTANFPRPEVRVFLVCNDNRIGRFVQALRIGAKEREKDCCDDDGEKFSQISFP